MSEQNQDLDMEQVVADDSELREKYLTFRMDKQCYGIPIFYVVQIITVPNMTVVPEFPSYAKGIIHLRGDVIPIISMRLRFGKVEETYDERTCIMIVSMKESLIGIIVDCVNEVVFIAEDAVTNPPLRDAMSSYLTGIGCIEKQPILLLDVERILSSEQITFLSEAG